jgi:hypothetical protein
VKTLVLSSVVMRFSAELVLLQKPAKLKQNVPLFQNSATAMAMLLRMLQNLFFVITQMLSRQH